MLLSYRPALVEDSPFKKKAHLRRHAGEGDRREQALLLPFSWGAEGAKVPFFKCNDLFSN